MKLQFSGDIWYWKGPAPHHFVTVPDEDCGAIEATSGLVSYGWGMIPATVRLGDTEWTTALFPKNGGYIVPIKQAVQRAEGVGVGDTVTITVSVAV